MTGKTTWIVLVAALAACALPDIHREEDAKPHHDAAVSDSGSGAETEAAVPRPDAQGDPQDPRDDPKNRNEDYATFRTLIPKAHVFAEWPMPDTSKYSKRKPSYTASEHVVTDNVTKLRWQRVLPEVYPGCTGEYDYVGRKRGVGSGCLWEEALAYCQRPELAEELGGGTWRLPTKIEIETLLDVSRINCIDPLFDTFPIDYVWSSSPVPNPIPDGLKLSWDVDFTNGLTTEGGRFKAGRPRCVSSANETGGSKQDFDMSVEYVARDTHTLLEWQQSPDGATRNYVEALEYCEQLELEGGGWHLPSLKELLTIVDSTRYMPSTNPSVFPLTHQDRYWTSSEYLDGRDMAYVVHFGGGASLVSPSLKELYYARCVR